MNDAGTLGASGADQLTLEGAFQEPLAPLIAHWSERIIVVNATLPGVDLYSYGPTDGSQG